MSNDYEYLGDSQIAPPMAPRPPTNAHPDLITGLSHTPALKSSDDVDLESNRPRDKNNLSFSDGLNPKRSEPSVVPSKTSRSTESDEESKKDGKTENGDEGEKKNHKCGTCWYIFAAVTIFLAVLSLLGLGAFLLMNSVSSESVSAALNGTNETSSDFETTANFSFMTTTLPNLINTSKSSTAVTKISEKSTSGSLNVSNATVIVPMSSVASTVSGIFTTAREVPDDGSNSTSEAIPANVVTTTEFQKVSIQTDAPTEELDEALPIEITTSASNVTVSIDVSTSSVLVSTVAESKSTTVMETKKTKDESSTADFAFTSGDLMNLETTSNGTGILN